MANIYFRALTLSIILITAAVLTGCSSGPKIFTNQDPAADFSRFKTYNYQAQLDTDKAGYESLTSQYLKGAVDTEMQARGYQQSNNPDLLVNFYLLTEEKIKTTQTPTSGAGYYGYRGYGAWGGYGGTQTTVTQYTEGTLNVDLVDRTKSQLVWEGALVGRVNDKVLEDLEGSINEAIRELFVNYPYVAGSNAVQEAPK